MKAWLRGLCVLTAVMATSVQAADIVFWDRPLMGVIKSRMR
jgi:hypothetical protein